MENKPSIGDFMIWIFVGAIPVLGFIMLIIWAVDSSNDIRKNWATATLIWTAITIFMFMMFAGMIGFISQMGQY